MTLRSWSILSQIFRGVNPYESLSQLRHAAAGTTGPHSPRAIAIARSRAKNAGYTPESLLLELGEVPAYRRTPSALVVPLSLAELTPVHRQLVRRGATAAAAGQSSVLAITVDGTRTPMDPELPGHDVGGAALEVTRGGILRALRAKAKGCHLRSSTSELRF